MDNQTYKLIGGILLALIVGVSGTTIYLSKTGEYNNCRGEWEKLNNGQYQCSKNGEIEWCYEVEYRGAGWYRCWIGEPIVPKDINTKKPDSLKQTCTPGGCK